VWNEYEYMANIEHSLPIIVTNITKIGAILTCILNDSAYQTASLDNLHFSGK